MTRILLTLLNYTVSLAVLIFQFIVPGYSDTLFYLQLALHAALWLAVFRLSGSAAWSPTSVVGFSAIAALLFSLAPFDITIPSLFMQPVGQAWLTVVLRFAIHAACLAIIVFVVGRRKEAA